MSDFTNWETISGLTVVQKEFIEFTEAHAVTDPIKANVASHLGHTLLTGDYNFLHPGVLEFPADRLNVSIQKEKDGSRRLDGVAFAYGDEDVLMYIHEISAQQPNGRFTYGGQHGEYPVHEETVRSLILKLEDIEQNAWLIQNEVELNPVTETETANKNKGQKPHRFHDKPRGRWLGGFRPSKAEKLEMIREANEERSDPELTNRGE
jgi:hypothetical protein